MVGLGDVCKVSRVRYHVGGFEWRRAPVVLTHSVKDRLARRR